MSSAGPTWHGKGPLYWGGVFVIYGVSVVVLALHGYQFTLAGVSTLQWLMGWATAGSLFIALLYLGFYLSYRDPPGRQVLRLAAWFGGGLVLLQGAFVVTIFMQVFNGATIVEPWYTTLIWLTGGALIGLLVGIYDVDRHLKAQEARAAIDQERTRKEQVLVLVRLFRHNLRNQVNLVMAALDNPTERSRERAQSSVDELIELSEKTSRLESLLDAPEATVHVDLADVVEMEVTSLRKAAPEASVETDLAEVPEVAAHPMVDMAVREALDNAVEHNESDEPSIEVTVERRRREDAEFVAVDVADDGPGIPESERLAFDNEFEKPLDHGSSIGLWFLSWIVRASGGALEVREREPAGTVVSMYFKSP